MRQIRSVTVLGAGTMGAQIAAHLANAGVPSLLLDLTPDVARAGLERASKLKPDPFFTPEARRLVSTGGFDDGLPGIGDSDWIVEAIVERLDVKQALFEKVERYRRPGSLVSSNTSGIPIGAIGAGRTDDFRRHFLGTHFFNPPRYLRLVEIIPTTDTDPSVVDAMARFADRTLGKGVVIAKDTPNFIANHVGLHGVMRVFDALATGRYSIEEIDAITGPALGRPNSATFRTLDIAGLDVLAHVTRNLAERLDSQEDRHAFALPPLVEELVTRGWVGEKAGQGFYKKVQQEGKSVILALDPATLEYRPQRNVQLGSIEAGKSIEDTGERIKTLFLGRDKVGEFLRETLGPVLLYTARVAPDIAHSIDDVDRAMRWGFGWELGPFETWDAIGVREVLDACGVSDPPPLVRDLLASGKTKFRDGDRGPGSTGLRLVPPSGPDLQILRSAKERSTIVKRNAGASLVDLGDGVLCVEFHSKANALGGDAIEMLRAGVHEASANFQALVVGNDAVNFSAGANLMLLLLEAQEGNWDDIDLMVRLFQGATMGLRYADVPVVVAPAGLTLGGGCEVALHGDRVQIAAETYMGLVEVGVGLIPAGGGTKEMLVRAMAHAPKGADPLPFVQRAFETIGFAKVSMSGADAFRIGYLREVDAVTMNRERLIADAKAVALDRVREGFRRPAPRTSVPVGGETVLASLKMGVHLAHRAGRISDHDRLIGQKLGWILAGGSLPHAAEVSEQYLLDLEREAFLTLCGERKTQERIGYTLKTGKTLRN
jgi:3-hydroxyacyl-CoA dehydrogenase